MKTDDIEFHFANPVMPVNNAKAAAQYYRDNLGFSIDVLWENSNYACVSRGGITIEFGEGRPQHVGSGVCVIQVSDVDKLYEEVKGLGVNLVGDFAERDYGSKDFRVRDYDGNLLIFGSALPNKSELIEKRNVA
jgi:uncharacterized glyoxalase superfamily protein PhnB